MSALAQVQAWVNDNDALLAERATLTAEDAAWALGAVVADYGFVVAPDTDTELVDVMIVLMAQSLPGPGTVADLAVARIEELVALAQGAVCTGGYPQCTGQGVLGVEPGGMELHDSVYFEVLCDECGHQRLRDT